MPEITARPVSVDDFESNGVFVCPFCGARISSRRKTCTEYVLKAGNHWEICYKNATIDERKAILDARK